MERQFYGNACIKECHNEVIEYYKLKYKGNYGLEVLSDNEISSFMNITHEESTIEKILDILLKNEVYPVHVPDIVTEMI